MILMNSPEGLSEAFICGGLPPLVNGPDSVYQRTYGVFTLELCVDIMLKSGREGA